MKKLSISVFAVLAIVFAVSSAFTSTSAKKASTSYAIWANTAGNTYLPTACSDANFQQQDIPASPLLFTQVQTQTSIYTKAQLDTYAVNHCAGAATQVCFVVLNLKDGSPDPAFATAPVVKASGASTCSIYYGTYF